MIARGVPALLVAHVQLVAFKLVFALAMLVGFDGGLVEVSSETVGSVEEHKLPPAPPHPRQAHRPCDGFARTDPPPANVSPPVFTPGHALPNGLQAPLRC